MNLHAPFIILFIASELGLGLTFVVAARIFDKHATVNLKSLLKGVVERTFLTICLVNNYPHALTLFGALKLGTRLKREDVNPAEGKSFNDYFLLGNMVSVAAAILYTRYYPMGI